MLSHVISIPFIALHSTHTALQLPQSPLLPCRRNISFPANSYPLKRWKFHNSLGAIFFFAVDLTNVSLRKQPTFGDALLVSLARDQALLLFFWLLWLEREKTEYRPKGRGHDRRLWFPRQMTSEKRAQKFHSDDASLPRSG